MDGIDIQLGFDEFSVRVMMGAAIEMFDAGDRQGAVDAMSACIVIMSDLGVPPKNLLVM